MHRTSRSRLLSCCPGDTRPSFPRGPRGVAALRVGTLLALLPLLAGVLASIHAQPPPPTGFTARDNPNDAGHGILLTWEAPAAGTEALRGYEIHRLPYRPPEAGPQLEPGAPAEAWILVVALPPEITTYTDQGDEPTIGERVNEGFIPRGAPVHYRMRSIGADGTPSAFTPVATGIAQGNWFHNKRWNVMVIAVLLGALMIYFISRAREGQKLYIRPIPGLSRIDEAIGRATEMGRPILFVLGTGTAGDIATLAGYTILARVAKRTAEYQTPLLVPVNEPVMMVMARGTVKEAYMEAGRPDVYNPDNVFYISAMQFPYVAAVNGLMLREKCATNFYMGVFHAESLLLAEAGSTTGAIQMSGTDQMAQIPFFVAATDYTLIGEELYAASAYLSQDPKQVGPLKAQDVVKALLILIGILGVLELSGLGSNVIRTIIAPH